MNLVLLSSNKIASLGDRNTFSRDGFVIVQESLKDRVEIPDTHLSVTVLQVFVHPVIEDRIVVVQLIK